MGAYSTLRITRSRARAEFLKVVLNPSDQQMEELLDRVLDERLYNVRIVNDDDENDDDRL